VKTPEVCVPHERTHPECFLCLEVAFCPSCAVSSTRMLVMDKYELHSDPCDRKLIRINNALQCWTMLIDTAAICIPELRDFRDAADCISQAFYCSLQACMVTQIHAELKHQRGQSFTQVATSDSDHHDKDSTKAGFAMATAIPLKSEGIDRGV